MPPPSYTRLLGRVYGVPTTIYTVFTAPPGYTVVVRDIILLIAGTEDKASSVWVRSQGVGYYLFHALVSPNASVHVDMRQALLVGDEIRASSEAPTWSLNVTGYAFTGEPASIPPFSIIAQPQDRLPGEPGYA